MCPPLWAAAAPQATSLLPPDPWVRLGLGGESDYDGLEGGRQRVHEMVSVCFHMYHKLRNALQPMSAASAAQIAQARAAA
eukprot:1617291-Pyramimonas_sp.AAC.1